MIIKKNDGTPFGTEHTANFAMKRKKLKDAKIVKIEGGFAIEVADQAPVETKQEAVIKPLAVVNKKPVEKRVEGFELPENNVDIDEKYVEQPYPRAQFTGDFKKPKVTYIPQECKNPKFTYKFLEITDFEHGNMCENWQTDEEVIMNMRRHPKYRHLVSRSDKLLRRGKRNELVLCRMPMEYKESWKKEQRERNNAALGKVKRDHNDPNYIHSAGLGG